MAEANVGSNEGGDEIHLRDVWYALVRSRWLVLGICVAVTALAAVLVTRQTPVYDAGATLRIDDRNQSQNLLGDLAPIAGVGKGRIETEMMVIRSRGIAEKVVDSLDMTVEVVAPRRPRDELLRTVSVPADDGAVGMYELKRQPDGSYAVSVSAGVPGMRHDARAVPGAPFRVGSATLMLQPALKRTGPEEILFTIRPYRSAVGVLRGGLRVWQPEPDAHVVAIAYRSSDRVMAAAVPNAVLEAFIGEKSQGSKTEARSTVNFLREQVSAYQGQLADAENQLRAFRESQQVVNLSEEASQQVKRLAELQAQRDQLRSEREALAKLLNRVGEAPRGAGEPSPYRQLASFPIFLSNRAVQDVLQALTELENERATLLVRRTPSNVDVQGVQERIGELEMQLFQLARNYLEGLDSQLASVEAALARFGTELEQIPAREVDFARLQRQQSLLEQIYSLLQTRLKEAEIREAVEPGDLRIIDRALVPGNPVSPRPVRTVTLALVLGMAMGIGVALARQALDTKVRSREDVEGATGGAPILAMIPRIRAARGAAAAANGNGNGNGNGKKGGKVAHVSPHALLEQRLVTQLDPRSPASEAYRALRTSITFASTDRIPQVLVVTSAMPGDGKSTSAANLAITLAQQGTRTLLVDADLRRGVLHKVFGVRQEPGLTQVLLGVTPLEEAVQQVETGATGTPLHLVATGVLPPNPAEVLGSSRMRELIASLRERYDMVVFDAPPLNLVTDAAVLGKLADSTLLIARTGATDKRALQHAAAQVRHIGAPVGGVVLNDIDLESGARYYGYGYGYGYGYRYGDDDNR